MTFQQRRPEPKTVHIMGRQQMLCGAGGKDPYANRDLVGVTELVAWQAGGGTIDRGQADATTIGWRCAGEGTACSACVHVLRHGDPTVYDYFDAMGRVVASMITRAAWRGGLTLPGLRRQFQKQNLSPPTEKELASMLGRLLMERRIADDGWRFTPTG